MGPNKSTEDYPEIPDTNAKKLADFDSVVT